MATTSRSGGATGVAVSKIFDLRPYHFIYRIVRVIVVKYGIEMRIHRSRELLWSVTMLPSWPLQKEAPVLKSSDTRLIFWKNFQASFLLPCISISSHSAFTNSYFFLRNKWRSSLLFSRYFSLTARVAADFNVDWYEPFFSIAAWRHGTSDSHQIWYLGLYTNS